MKQLLQDISSGSIEVHEVPAPWRPKGWLLVATRASLISAGTERAVMEMGSASLVGKARARPDLVRKTLGTARSEGLASTYAKVRGRLEEPNALGYSSCGIVLEAGDDAPAGPGELVACAGAGYACHAEVVTVPGNLCARVPNGVAPESAAYATVAAIALHGLRLTRVSLGEVVTVIGLGLVGQLTLDLVASAGCVAVGYDPDEGRVADSRKAGFFATSSSVELEAETGRLTDGRGADGVLVTAASRTPAPLETAIASARERATLCVVGDVSIQAPRTALFQKELCMVVSRSYGPGRYDPSYEEGGVDYPAGYVRWTEGRNLAEALRLMATGDLRPERLTTHTFDLPDGPQAYALLEGKEPSLGIVLNYPDRIDAPSRTVAIPRKVRNRPLRRRQSVIRLGVVGAGTFARSVLLPHLSQRTELVAVAAATGMSARSSAERFGARRATTDAEQVLGAEDVDAVVIATRHDTHADYVVTALNAGKNVFVEKPLALDEAELQRVQDAAATSAGVLMVGFNRRFAPMILRIREQLGSRGPLVVTYRINAGRLPRSHWTHDAQIGGGRIVGEACHFVDTLTFLAGAQPRLVSAAAAEQGSEPREDVIAASLAFGDGSIGQVIYSAFGDQGMSKERIEVLGEHGAAELDDFRRLVLHRGGRTETVTGSRDKGHRAELDCFLHACATGVQPWPISDMLSVMRVTFAVRDVVQGRLVAAG